jgi:hypothetical protein
MKKMEVTQCSQALPISSQNVYSYVSFCFERGSCFGLKPTIFLPHPPKWKELQACTITLGEPFTLDTHFLPVIIFSQFVTCV